MNERHYDDFDPNNTGDMIINSLKNSLGEINSDIYSRIMDEQSSDNSNSKINLLRSILILKSSDRERTCIAFNDTHNNSKNSKG
jgi:hypothetical protein